MPAENLAEIQNDHKHWLNDLERWQYEAGTWLKHRQEIVDELRQFLDRVEQHGSQLQQHVASLEQHQREIVEAERCLVESGGTVTGEISASHLQTRKHHQQLLDVHERLKEQAHTYMAQVAMNRHQPSRRE